MLHGYLEQSNTETRIVKLSPPQTRPFHTLPNRAGPKAGEADGEKVNEMLVMKVIESAQSPWASSIVCVQKKGDTLLFCVDHREHNAVTTSDSYPLPRIYECIDSLEDVMIFSTLDTSSGY